MRSGWVAFWVAWTGACLTLYLTGWAKPSVAATCVYVAGIGLAGIGIGSRRRR